MFRYTYIDKKGKLLCDVAEYVRKHNIVYQTPAYKVREGLPLGNGYMGGLVYQTDRELCMRICRTDSFDYSKGGNFGAWSHEWEEKCTTLASCGIVKISDGTPAFAWEYLDDYDMTLDLGKAQIDLASKTPFSEYKVRGYGSLEDKCIVWQIEASSEEPLERTITLERYGTRGFFHYYECITRDTARRLYNIHTSVKDGCMMVTQKLNGCTFTTAVRVEGDGVRYVISNKREVKCILPASEKAQFKVYITNALSCAGEDTESIAASQLADAVHSGEKVYVNHIEWWKEYWNRSFISVEDDFAENFYYINRYQFGSAGFGTFPPSVFGSLWTAFGDSRNWGHYYHWNDQMQFWPCDAWNHGELLKPYFDYRRGMLSNAINDCREYHGAEGAWYSDIASADGYQAIEPDTKGNMTCGAMISIQMYRHYKHFPDRDFLMNTAYPVMKACGDMYLSLLKKGDDGKYHIHDVTAMEGYLYMNDAISDWAMSRALFKALLDVAKEAGASEELKKAWQDKHDHLFDPPTFEVDGKTMFAYGRLADGSVCLSGEYPESDMAQGGIGAMMCVFPGSTHGKYTDDEPCQKIVKNIVEATAEGKYGAGWYIDYSALARFGYGEELWKRINGFMKAARLYPNGLIQGDEGTVYTARVIPAGTKNTHFGELHEKDTGERIVYPSERFFQCYTEPEGGICTAINDSLLQSWEDIIRVFPAAGDGLFSLHAQGDFMVTSQKTNGKVRFVSIESRCGGKVTLESPFEKGECVRLNMADHAYDIEIRGEQRLIRFDTEPGETYVVFSRFDHIDGSYPTVVFSHVNTEPKKCGERTIGRVRDF